MGAQDEVLTSTSAGRVVANRIQATIFSSSTTMTDAAEPTHQTTTITTEDITLEEDDLFHCKLLSIKVENRIFRVPRELLESYSDVFKDMFSLPITNDEPVDGERDSAPLVLEGIKKEDFRAFLSVLSSLHYESVIQSKEVKNAVFIIARWPLYNSLQQKDWIAALRLSHMWGLENVQKKAIKELENDATLGMIQRLELANEFQITSWIRPAYHHLLTRTQELDATEIPWMGPSAPQFVEKVAKGREEREKLFLLRIMSRDIAAPRCPSCGGENRLKFADSVKLPSPTSRGGPNHIKWSFRCNGGFHSTLTWTLEELVHHAYNGATGSDKSLMNKDIDLIIDNILPVS